VCQLIRDDYHGNWKSFESNPSFNYTFRRTLEQLLSVCSIPVNPGDGKRVTVILTDGHVFSSEMDVKTSLYVMSIFSRKVSG
jgi:hypothetical protein